MIKFWVSILYWGAGEHVLCRSESVHAYAALLETENYMYAILGISSSFLRHSLTYIRGALPSYACTFRFRPIKGPGVHVNLLTTLFIILSSDCASKLIPTTYL